MIREDFLAALPLVVLTGTILVVMLTIAIRRHHATAALLTLAGLAATLMSLPVSRSHSPRAITPLLVQDEYGLFFTGLFAAAAIASTALSWPYLGSRRGRHEEYYLLLLLATLGAAVIVSTRHLAALFLGLEILSVSLYVLVAYSLSNPRSLEAGIKYLILAGVSSALLLFGIALIYADLGALGFAQIAHATGGTSLLITAGLGLIVAGAGFKLSLVPFHLWTPDVFEGAPAPVGGFLASVSKGAMAALLVRLFLDTQAYRFGNVMFALGAIAIASILAGNLLALLQDNVKRLLAYSSIAHLGYILVALLVGGALGAEAVTYYLAAYIVMNLGAFGVISALSQNGKGDEVEHTEQLRGLFWRHPWLAGALATALLSLAGIPLTAGFIAKFYVFAAGIDGARWLLIATVVIGSAIGLYYYLRIVIVLFSPAAVIAETGRSSPLGNAVIAILTFFVIALGLYPAPVSQVVRATVLSIVQ